MKIYLQDKIDGSNEGYFVSFDNNGNVITKQITYEFSSIPLTVYAPEGSTVTVSKTENGHTITYTQNPDPVYYSPADSTYLITSEDNTFMTNKGNEYVFYLEETGIWTVTATRGSNSVTSTIPINSLEPYSERLTFFTAYINTYFPDDATSCTCVYPGTNPPDTTITLICTADDLLVGHKRFIIPNAGTWTINASDGSNSSSKTFIITTDGQEENANLSWT